MDIIEVIVLIVTFVSGSALTYIGVFINEHRLKKKHFKSLYGEIISNYRFLEYNEELFDGSYYDAPFDDFINLSYHNILISGNLYELEEKLQRKIQDTYSMINQFNKERNKKNIWGGDLDEFFNGLEIDLKVLIKEIPKALSYIKPIKL